MNEYKTQQLLNSVLKKYKISMKKVLIIFPS